MTPPERREGVPRDLEARYREAMDKARAAPMNPYRMDADGHRWVEPVSDAWARHAREAGELRQQIKALPSRKDAA